MRYGPLVVGSKWVLLSCRSFTSLCSPLFLLKSDDTGMSSTSSWLSHVMAMVFEPACSLPVRFTLNAVYPPL